MGKELPPHTSRGRQEEQHARNVTLFCSHLRAPRRERLREQFRREQVYLYRPDHVPGELKFQEWALSEIQAR